MKNKVSRSITLFALLSVLGLVLLLFPGIVEGASFFRGIAVWSLVLCAVLLGVELVLGALRVHIFSRLHGADFRTAWQANLAGLFLSYATPFQAGGAAGQIYVLNRKGVPLEKGVAISFMHLFGSLAALLPAASFLLFNADLGDSLLLKASLRTASIALLISVGVLLGFLFVPHAAGRTLSRIATRLTRIVPGSWTKQTFSLLSEKGMQLADAIVAYRGTWAVWINLLISVLLLANKLNIGLVILYGMGCTTPLAPAITGVLALVFLQYVSPTPGGSLISEGFVLVIIPLIAPTLPPFGFALLWRSFIAYIPAAISGFLVAGGILKGEVGKAV